MPRKKLSVCVSITLLILLFFLNVDCARTIVKESEPTKNRASTDLFAPNFWIFLSERYDFLDTDIRFKVVADISFNSITPPIVPHTITFGVPFSLTKVNLLPENGSYTYGFWGYPPVGVLTASFPTYTRNGSIRLEGYLSGKSVFWKNTVEIRLWNVTSSLFGVNPYNLVLVPPTASRVLKVYSSLIHDLTYQKATIGGLDSLVVPDVYGPTVVLYEAEAWQTNAFIVMAAMIFLAYAILNVTSWRAALDKAHGLLARLRRLAPSELLNILRSIYNTIVGIDSTKLLTIYVLVALLMVSLSVSAGPDPRLKVYVMSSTEENAATISYFIGSQLNVDSITIFDEMSEFDLLASLGTFQAVIVGDYFPPTRNVVETYIYPGLDVVHNILVLKNDAVTEFSDELQRRYSRKTIIVDDLSSLSDALPEIPKRTNVLNLRVGVDTYRGVAAIVGLGSILLFSIGLAFLSCKLIEVGKKPLVSGLVEAVAFSILVFFFTETIYIACSVMLGIPLGLHASSPKVTALGFMNFGGGTRLRMFAGLAGFLFGGLISLKEGLKLDKIGVLAFIVMAFFIVVDPLTGGLLFYEFVLLFTVGPGLEAASVTMFYVKDFLAFGGLAFGGWVSSVYAISTGTILFFAAAVPLWLFPKLRKSTATFLLLFCAFGAANGGVRVANMRPWMTVASILPGVVIGIFLCVFFYLISVFETGLRTKLRM